MRRMVRSAVLLLVLGMGAIGLGQKHEPRGGAPPQGGAVQSGPQLDVAKLMSAGEFRDAGLGKLSPEELTALNRWLNAFAMRIWELKEKSSGSCADVIESKI